MRKSGILGQLFLLFILMIGKISAGADLYAGTGTPTLNGIEAPGEWPAQSITTSTGVTLKAMVDGVNFYLLATWADETGTESIHKSEWTYNGSTWSQSNDQDRLGIYWDMGLNEPDGASCITMCHPPVMRTNHGKCDLWHWKAAQTNPVGYLDDTYIDTVNRHPDAGTAAYASNSSSNGHPTYMATGDPGVNAIVLLNDASVTYDPFGVMTATSAIKTAFDTLAAWSSGQTIAGNYLKTPTGSRADVRSAGKFSNGTWTVEFSRPILASPDDDFIPVSGGTVEFTVAEWDNSGDMDHMTDTNVHTLHLPAFSAVNPSSPQTTPKVFDLVCTYPNPFNAETVINYQLEKPEIISLIIYDSQGREISMLYQGNQTAGSHYLTWRPENISAGIYLVQLSDGQRQSILKVLYVK